jgi:hypothetical protein
VNSPSQVFNPEKLLVDTGDINNALTSHFSSNGQDRVDTENNIFQCEVEDFVSKIDQNLITSDTPITLNIFNRVFPPYFRNSLGISSIPQTFPDLRLSNTDLMFSRWILSVMGVYFVCLYNYEF